MTEITTKTNQPTFTFNYGSQQIMKDQNANQEKNIDFQLKSKKKPQFADNNKVMNYQAMTNQTLQKREEFSVSLRSQKKGKVLALKRARNARHLTKAKFLYQASQKNSGMPASQVQFQIKSKQVLIDILIQIEKSLAYPFGDPNSFAVDDLIQILKEMRHIGQSTQLTPQYETLMNHPSTKTILTNLLTREYDTSGSQHTDGGYVDPDQLVDLLTQVCWCFSICSTDDGFASRVVQEFDILPILQAIIKRYFLEEQDPIQIIKTRQAKDKERLDLRIKLLMEMIWVTNNFMAHDSVSKPLSSIELAQTYWNLIDFYMQCDFEINQSAHVSFTSELWQVLAWGFQTMAPHIKVNKEDQLNNMMPFISFINDHMFSALQKVQYEITLKSQSNEVTDKDLNYAKDQLRCFEKDILGIMGQVAKKCSDIDIQKCLGKEQIEMYVFKQLHNQDPSDLQNCLTILGQLVAIEEDHKSLEYVENYDLLASLQWVILEGRIQEKKDAIWVLQTLGCNGQVADIILQSPTNICSNLILQCKSNKLEIQTEAFLCLGTLVQQTTKGEYVKRLIGMGVIGVIHDELLRGSDHGVLQVQMLETLNHIFKKIPGEADKFVRNYGADVFEHQQYSKHDYVIQAVEELLNEHFETVEAGRMDDPWEVQERQENMKQQVDLQDAAPIGHPQIVNPFKI